MTSRPAFRRCAPVALALLAVAMGGCARSHKATAPAASAPTASPSATASAPTTATVAPPAVPTTAPPPVAFRPEPLPTRKPPVVPPGTATLPVCRTGALTVVFTTVTAGSLGQRVAFFELRSTAGTPCRLTGRPDIALLGRNGAPLPVTVSPADIYAAAPVRLDPGTVPIVAGRNGAGHGFAALVYNPVHSSHGFCDSTRVRQASSLRFALPGQPGARLVPARPADGSGQQVASCDGEIGVSVFASKATVEHV